jgi:pyridoxine kinase
MFAALMVARFREAVAGTKATKTESRIPPDNIEGVELPLAKAMQKAVAGIQEVLEKTKRARDTEMEVVVEILEEKDSEKRLHLSQMKAAEVKLVRNMQSLRSPALRFKAKIEIQRLRIPYTMC